jgi:hypothetical protein
MQVESGTLRLLEIICIELTVDQAAGGTQEKPRVFLLGQGAMPVLCAELLLQAGFYIEGLHGPDHQLADWARRHNDLRFYADFDHFKASAGSTKYEFLFSIVNFRILDAEILRSPRVLAINYHDGPLPRYAGSHAPAWAYRNKEGSHGVTWHVIEERVDAGDILKQASFPLSPEETLESLSQKCYLMGIRAFRELIAELKLGTYSRFPQDLSQRTFYHRGDIPN